VAIWSSAFSAIGVRDIGISTFWAGPVHTTRTKVVCLSTAIACCWVKEANVVENLDRCIGLARPQTSDYTYSARLGSDM